MCSFDISSLFTNVPLEETINPVVRPEQKILPNVQVSSSSHFSNEEVQSRSGVIWRRLQEGESFRRSFSFENVFTPKPGPTAYSCRQVLKESP